ncbi:MAG: large conductance mechanosensitive channel protein MscL [Leptolyngbya foveolarum]|uniref:Large-conductance mechanosensitive channel n=1 Tax=Leptolyngbya foveolarum TaxID=47253 RepID=A0A2W4TZU8_9CYAN|nr:MAG: large conductance mechanosensitive channel protein MscL [Leptolyngbya foveolarum]
MANRQTRNRATSSVSSFANDFKEFLMRGNVVDLAVAVVLGAAFTAIVTSLVEDIITPLLLNPALSKAEVSNIEELAYGNVLYGSFLAAVIKFIIVGFVLFIIVRAFERFKRTEEVVAEPTLTEKLGATMLMLNETLERKL